MDNKIQTPESVLRLFDLVMIKDNKIKTAFYFGLRDCLVANTLDQAIRIAYAYRHNKTYKVVTLNGELIQESGTITGGGGKPRCGRLRLENSSASPIMENEVSENNIDQLPCIEIFQSQLNRNKLKQKALYCFISKLERSRNKIVKLFSIFSEQNLGSNIEVYTYIRRIKSVFQNLKLSHHDDMQNKAKIRIMLNQSNFLQIFDNFVEKQESKIIEIKEKRHNVQQKLYDCSLPGLFELVKLNTILSVWKSKKTHAYDKVKQNHRILRTETTKFQHLTSKQLYRRCQFTGYYKSVSYIIKKIETYSIYERIINRKFSTVNRSLKKIEQKRFLIKTVILHIVRESEEILNRISKLTKWLRSLLNKIDDVKNNYFSHNDFNENTILFPSLNSQPVTQNIRSVTYQVLKFQIDLEHRKKAGVDISSIEEYCEHLGYYFRKTDELEDVIRFKKEIIKKLENKQKLRTSELMVGLHEISFCLKEIYQAITSGGDAELELVNWFDPFKGGIIFSVRPPNKSWKNILNISGGEKTLSSLSLVFALHCYRPTPFYMMDEIDSGSLDFKNATIVSRYIKNLSRQAQFILISLRTEMIVFAQRLIGIYKVSNYSHTVLIQSSKLLQNKHFNTSTSSTLLQSVNFK
jgi:structural maintenance of chromosome 4